MRRAVLVGVELDGDLNFEYHMEELKGLAEACELEAAAYVTQKLPAVNAALYVGSGKAEEIRRTAEMVEADCVVVDNSLKPSQQRNLQKELDLPVMDRTNLILQIFEKRARTKEAKLQVESANLQYMLPRLVGMREALSRQGGGAGAGGGSGAGGGLANRGAGEQKLELDRRKIEKRISELRRDLEAIEQDRATQRQQRRKSELPSVALVGYTNAGKSTLLNKMLDIYMGEGPKGDTAKPEKALQDTKSDAEMGADTRSAKPDRSAYARKSVEEKKVLEKDMLFATLDTTVRRISPGDNRDFLLSDTVGFIDRLPHTLIKAFRSTLAEACGADLLLQVVDYSDPHHREQMQVTEDTLRELGAERIPCISIMNKADLVMEESELPKIVGDKIFMSAKKGIGMEELLDIIREKLFGDYVACEMLIPYTDGGAVAYLKEHAVVNSLEYGPDGAILKLLCKKSDAGRYEKYIRTY
ncbi:MAG: GTPase HflX [Clostridiales bacterium]|nr:GTPase HflX [Clostridiales bacterium]